MYTLLLGFVSSSAGVMKREYNIVCSSFHFNYRSRLDKQGWESLMLLSYKTWRILIIMACHLCTTNYELMLWRICSIYFGFFYNLFVKVHGSTFCSTCRLFEQSVWMTYLNKTLIFDNRKEKEKTSKTHSQSQHIILALVIGFS